MGMERNEIRVNRDYQRSDKVWPEIARSFLIETILLNFPMPKLALRQLLDVKTRKSYREVVDGQQRCQVIRDFALDKYRISTKVDTSELRGKSYGELDEEYQRRFLSYPIQIDTYVGVTDEEVRETFRRINSYTVPLNPEELRHAQFQGLFKWFVNRMATRFGRQFEDSRLFTEKQLVRMADAKLLTELGFSYFNGIQTTSKVQLDKLYRSFDARFDDEAQLEARMSAALDEVFEWEQLHGTSLMRPFMAFSLILAVLHVRFNVTTLQPLFISPELETIDPEVAIPALLNLADEFDRKDDGVALPHQEFVNASESKTNTKAQREIRFSTYVIKFSSFWQENV